MNKPTYPLALWTGYRMELEFIYDLPVPNSFLNHQERFHEVVSARLVRKGRVEVQSDGDHAVASEGQWLICCGKQIAHTIESGTHLLSLRFVLKWPVGPSFLRGSTLQVLECSKWPGLEAATMALFEVLPGQAERFREGYFYRLQGEESFSFQEYVLYRERLHHWTSELIRALHASGRQFYEPTAVDPRLKKIISFLTHYPLSAPFPKAAMERIGGVQLKRLNQISSDAFGMTLFGLWDQQRYKYAQQTLRFTYLSVKEVASNLGFKRLQHFSGWFRTHSGLSPRDFRKSVLQSEIAAGMQLLDDKED